MDPKIELHVHLEGTVRAPALLRIARRNACELPAATEAELAELYEFRDFDHFIELWIMTTHAIRTEVDFREVVVDYAREAAGHGAVYLEGIFTPAERVRTGASWDEVFTGFCDGAAAAEAETGVIVRLTPDIPRGFPLEAALETARYAVKYADRGVVGPRASAGWRRSTHPSRTPTRSASRRTHGLGSVPHAGEVAGPGVDPRRARRPRRRPAPPRHPRRRGRRPARRARRSAASCATCARCRTCGPEPCRRSPSTRCPRCRRGRPLLDQHRRPRDVRAPISRPTTRPRRTLGLSAEAAFACRARGRAVRRRARGPACAAIGAAHAWRVTGRRRRRRTRAGQL